MKIEEKFNVRSANLVKVQPPHVGAGHRYSSEGVKLTFYRFPDDPERNTISMHLTPRECMDMAERLLEAARRVLDSDAGSYGGRAV